MTAGLASCDACGNDMPRGCLRTMMSCGGEGSFCCECRSHENHELCDVEWGDDYIALFIESADDAEGHAARYEQEARTAVDDHWRRNRTACAENARRRAAHSRKIAEGLGAPHYVYSESRDRWYPAGMAPRKELPDRGES